jgi:CRISPR-associated protein Cmr6
MSLNQQEKKRAMIDPSRIRQKLSEPQWGAQETNAGLWLDKYMWGDEEASKRRDLVHDVAKLPEPQAYKGYYRRWQEMLREYSVTTQMREVRVKGRMVVGLGSESVLETSICLHRTYGVPYIPGSALKGLASSYAHQRLGEEWRLGGKLHTILFGDTDNAGYITFFDALYIPGSGKMLYPDVITVHHEGYYQNAEKKAPSDSDDPNPIPFLSATGTYLLALAAPDFQQPTRWVDMTFQILAEALEKMGIGAKTSSGYGRMTFIDPPIRPLDPELATAQNYKRQIEAFRERDVAGQLPAYYNKWQRLTSEEARKIVALAIIDAVKKFKRERQWAERAWYQELLTFLGEN